MRKTTIAKRYAKALIETGQETGTSKEIARELRDVFVIFSSNPEAMVFLLNPMYKLEDRKGLVEKICDSLKISDIIKRFLILLVQGRKVSIFQDICNEYYRMEDEIAGRIRAKVESSVDLTDNLKTNIKDKLQRLTSKEVILTTDRNPNLIGGLVIRVGNMIFDGSVKTQLERVKNRLKA